jgi:hypothetical protein
MFGVFDAIDLDYVKLPTAVGCSLGMTMHPYRNSSIEAVCGAEVSAVRQFRLTLC